MTRLILSLLLSVFVIETLRAQQPKPNLRDVNRDTKQVSGSEKKQIANEQNVAHNAVASVFLPFVDQKEVAGVVSLVANKERVLDITTAGLADIATRRPMHEDDLFWIASMSKPITAAAIMMLVDDGKVNVDDPVEKYLPEFKGLKVAAKTGTQDKSEATAPHLPRHPILIRNILSHTSGLPFKSSIEEPTLDLKPLSERVASYSLLNLDFEPDSKYQYSNAGINTAGRIIEVVSGTSFEDFLQQRLFDRLEMPDTTFWPNAEQVDRIAKSYKANKEKTDLEETRVTQLQYPLNDRIHRFSMPAGGLFSTATDCAHFCQMLLNGGVYHEKRILSESAVKQMTSRQTPAEVNNSYGFGFATGDHTYGHGGAYSTNMNVDLQTGLITIFMVQNAGWRSDEGKKIEGLFRAEASKLFGK